MALPVRTGQPQTMPTRELLKSPLALTDADVAVQLIDCSSKAGRTVMQVAPSDGKDQRLDLFACIAVAYLAVTLGRTPRVKQQKDNVGPMKASSDHAAVAAGFTVRR
jgi:hypothetical protein